MSWTCPIHGNLHLIRHEPMACGCYRIDCAICRDAQLVMSDACRKAADDAKRRARAAVEINRPNPD